MCERESERASPTPSRPQTAFAYFCCWLLLPSSYFSHCFLLNCDSVNGPSLASTRLAHTHTHGRCTVCSVALQNFNNNNTKNEWTQFSNGTNSAREKYVHPMCIRPVCECEINFCCCRCRSFRLFGIRIFRMQPRYIPARAGYYCYYFIFGLQPLSLPWVPLRLVAADV